MTTNVGDVVDAGWEFFCGLQDKTFAKSKALTKFNERDLLPLFRCFLLGRFGNKLEPEIPVRVPTSIFKSGWGRIDFRVGDIAVEFAVRTSTRAGNQLSASTNKREVVKLLKYDGRAALLLFDFAAKPLDPNALEKFKIHPTFGRGNHRKSAFTVAYYYVVRGDGRGRPRSFDCVQKQVRTRSQ